MFQDLDPSDRGFLSAIIAGIVLLCGTAIIVTLITAVTTLLKGCP